MKKILLSLILLALLFPAAVPTRANESDAELIAKPRWQQLFPPVSPSPRVSHAMAYDCTRGVAVVFGGLGGEGGSEGLHDDTWEWDSASMTWTERLPVHRPSPRYGAAMVYDEARGVTLLFGGTTASFFFNDTWEWDGNDWTQVFPANSPSGRWQPSMIYDSQRQVIVLFGGQDPIALGDTWEWDGTNWTEQLIAGPGPRGGAGMAYDQNRNVTVLFGGNAGLLFYDDTWERAGGGLWQQVTPPKSPSKRDRPGMVYFPTMRKVILFGGVHSQYFDDTYFWDGVKWRTRTLHPRPPGRCCMAMVYDSVLGGVLLFGGSISSVDANDTWLFR